MSRSFAELHRQVVFGRSGGRIIWQPRILAWVTDKEFAGEPFPPPFTGMTPYEIYRELDLFQFGCTSTMRFGASSTIGETFERVKLNEIDTKTTPAPPARIFIHQ